MNPRRHAAIEEAHPDGIVEPHMQPEDSWLFDMWDDLFARLGRIRGAELTHKRPFLETALDPDMDPEESGGEVYDDLSASYRELFLGFTAADCHYEHDVEIGECDGRQRCLRARGVIGCITAVSLVAPFALVEPDYLEHLEDGTTCVPSIERGVYDEDGRPAGRWIGGRFATRSRARADCGKSGRCANASSPRSRTWGSCAFRRKWRGRRSKVSPRGMGS